MVKKSMIEKIKSNKKYYRILFVSWLFAFLFLTVAFAGYTKTLNVESKATMQTHIYDYVYISHVSVSDSSNATNNQYSFLDHELNASVSATTCNSYVTYKIDIILTNSYLSFEVCILRKQYSVYIR